MTKTVFRPFVLCVVMLLTVSVATAAEPVSLESLLKEMVDRTAIAKYPEPFCTCKQASSYDRKSVTPEDHDAWFANGDTAQFVREETNGGRKEWVLMDVEGPGAIVRWWITAPHYRTTIRIYLDGSTTPEIEARADELVGGDFLVGAPLSAEKARGRNLYLPIPYAKSCKVTADIIRTGDKNTEQGNLYYQINYRTYAAGTEVKTFTMYQLKFLQDRVNNIQKTLLDFGSPQIALNMGVMKAGETYRIDERKGPGMIGELVVKIDADDVPQALRSMILKIDFDGETTVYCPVGEFFGSGVGTNPYQNWWMQVYADGMMISNWPMPYKEKCNISFLNVGDKDVSIGAIAPIDRWDWDERSMYFHCNWRQEREIATRPFRDWEYVKLSGEGVFVGDVLSVWNRDPAWWGEGDEKIYVDGETFPSHFGTGTEDYYGYAWCTPTFFEAPFHAQPRAEGPNNYGHTTNLRVRSLDGIPFTKDFRFDMEVWHWAEKTQIDYAAATFWYGKPGAKAVDAPRPDAVDAEAKMPVVYDSPKFLPRVPGFTFKNAPPGHVQVQDMGHFQGGKWKNDRQLWWTGANPGDKMELLVTLEKAGPQKLVCSMTKAVDYGTVQFYLDGNKVGKPVDLFNDGVIPTGDVEVGSVDVPAGEHTLTVEIVGKNEKATNFLFGIDALRFE